MAECKGVLLAFVDEIKGTTWLAFLSFHGSHFVFVSLFIFLWFRVKLCSGIWYLHIVIEPIGGIVKRLGMIILDLTR